MRGIQMTRRNLRSVLTMLFTVSLTGCPQRTAVWVRVDSTASNLVLQFGRERGIPGGAAIGVIRVYRCDGPATGDGASWVVGPVGGTNDVTQIRYGETPPGFSSDQGPLPLTPGCYKVDVSGTGKTAFVVDSSGKVIEQPRSD